MPRPLTEFFKTHGWCQGYFAKTATGGFVGTRHKNAVNFCLSGAASRAGVDAERVAKAMRFKDCMDMVAWNDTPGRTKEEVMQRIEEAGL